MNKELVNLYKAMLNLKNEAECDAFLKDLCTPQELKSLSERFNVAEILFTKKLSYRDIHKLTGVSIATITRVARFLNHEHYKGYKLILHRLHDQ